MGFSFWFVCFYRCAPVDKGGANAATPPAVCLCTIDPGESKDVLSSASPPTTHTHTRAHAHTHIDRFLKASVVHLSSLSALGCPADVAQFKNNYDIHYKRGQT